MKYLLHYKLYESESYQRMIYIVQYLKDLCLELTQAGANWYIVPSDDIKAKVLGLKLFSDRDYPSFWIDAINTFFIMINVRNIFRRGNNVSWFFDLLYHIESFMDSQGFELRICDDRGYGLYYGKNVVKEFEDDLINWKKLTDIQINFVKKDIPNLIGQFV